ncbi:MAG: hypothetical protein WKF56_09390, partial [Candidatus Limnocylindrales bacterium]
MPASRVPATSAPIATEAPTETLIGFLARRVKDDPSDGESQRDLGLAILQRIRETADPSRYPAAEAALTAARRLRPDDPTV